MRVELQQALDAWQRATDHLVALVQSVDPEQWSSPSSNAGWSKKDLLAHLATGYVQRLALLQSILETGRPGVPPDADAANAQNIEAQRSASVTELVAELVTTRGRVLGLMRQLREGDLNVMVEDDGGHRLRLGADLLDWSRHDLEHAAELA